MSFLSCLLFAPVASSSFLLFLILTFISHASCSLPLAFFYSSFLLCFSNPTILLSFPDFPFSSISSGLFLYRLIIFPSFSIFLPFLFLFSLHLFFSHSTIPFPLGVYFHCVTYSVQTVILLPLRFWRFSLSLFVSFINLFHCPFPIPFSPLCFLSLSSAVSGHFVSSLPIPLPFLFHLSCFFPLVLLTLLSYSVELFIVVRCSLKRLSRKRSWYKTVNSSLLVPNA